MRADEVGDDTSAAALNRGARAQDSTRATPRATPKNTPRDLPRDIPRETPQNIASESIAPDATPVEIETIKTCCICGMDLTHKERARDRSGRYWCKHCEGFVTENDKLHEGMSCPDCGRDRRQNQMVDRDGVKVCFSCNEVFLAEAEPRRQHKAAVTADPELAIRKLIQKMVNAIAGLAAAALLVTLYHFRLLYVRPMAWVPFVWALYVLAALAVGVLIAIGTQYLRIAYRLSTRRADYDKMLLTAANHLLAFDDESHSMGISESPEPLRRRANRAIARVEACAGQGVSAAAEILESLAEKGKPEPIIHFLLEQRPNTVDTVARNREIATVSYLHNDLVTSSASVTAILLRLNQDQEAMTRRALICYRNGELEQAKKIFKRVIYTAREKKIELDLAEAYCNLGMLHLMLSEYDDADVRYSQAMQIYNRLSREEGQADCLLSLGLIAYRQKKGAAVEDNFRRAMAINKRRKRYEGLSICCSLLGVILIEKEPPQLREAERLLNRALQLNVQLGRPGGAAAAYGNLGLVRVKKGDLAGARDLFLKAQSIYQRISRPKMMAKIQGMLKTVGTMSAASNK